MLRGSVMARLWLTLPIELIRFWFLWCLQDDKATCSRNNDRRDMLSWLLLDAGAY